MMEGCQRCRKASASTSVGVSALYWRVFPHLETDQKVRSTRRQFCGIPNLIKYICIVLSPFALQI